MLLSPVYSNGNTLSRLRISAYNAQDDVVVTADCGNSTQAVLGLLASALFNPVVGVERVEIETIRHTVIHRVS